MQKVDNLNQSKDINTSSLHGRYTEGAYRLRKDVTIFVLKQTLLETGIEEFEMVERSLYEKYRYELSDCFENPECLSDVLRYVYDGSYAKIVESIGQKLDRFAQEVGIKEFLEKIR